MTLTNEMAEKHVGKYIDCYKRLFGYYPMQIIKFPDGSLGVKDATGTCTKIEDEGFNARYYDYIFEMIEVTKYYDVEPRVDIEITEINRG